MVLVDTGFWLALANRRDQMHARAQELLAELESPLITTWPVMTETCHLLLHRLGIDPQLAFLKSYQQGAFQVFALTEEHASRILTLMKKYKDLPMDLADASLVVLAEVTGEGRILSTDQRDFRTYRWKNRKPFCNLLLGS